jgi:alkanesulfonate monooxygenase SsuD/methylene tetrahydromethanopterin reductase-like flavin-dependent oxidoreductase (luciferase family)
VRLGVVILPELRRADLVSTWCRAEELGFDHAWTYDHLAWRSLRDSTWFAAVPTLAVAAAVTRRIRLGTLVASPNFRHPVSFARELIGLDDVSGGRFTLGIGAGGMGWDATILGQQPWSPRERADRFEEFVALSDRLLREPVTSYQGRFYSAHEAHLQPGCVQRPRIPFAIAATRRRGMRLAATYGQLWVTTGERTSETKLEARRGAAMVRAQLARLEEACAESGRDPASLQRVVLAGTVLDAGLGSVESFRETLGRYAECGVTDFVVHWPRASEPFRGDLAVFERVVASAVQAAPGSS